MSDAKRTAEEVFKKWAALPDYKKIDKGMETSLVSMISDAIFVEQSRADKFKKIIDDVKGKLQDGIHRLNIFRR